MTYPLQLPQGLPTAAAWQLSDFRPLTLQTPPAATDAATITTTGPAVPLDELWLLDHAVVSCTSGTETGLRLYDGQVAPSYLIDGSDRGNFDVADWPNGLQLAPGGQLVVVWTNAGLGAVGTMTIQARVMRRS